MLEGEVTEPARPDRLPDDPGPASRRARRTSRPSEYEIPFRPGNFAWGPGQPRPQVSSSRSSTRSPSALRELAQPGRRAGPARRPVPARRQGRTCPPRSGRRARGRPQGRADGPAPAQVQGAGHAEAQDVFEGEDRWFMADKRLYHVSQIAAESADARRSSPSCSWTGPSWSTTSSSRPRTPARTGSRGSATATRRARSGRYDWPLDGQAGKPVALPDSDLTVTFARTSVSFPTDGTGLGGSAGRIVDPARPVQGPARADGAEVVHYGWAIAADVPERDPERAGGRQAAASRWSRSITIFPPAIDPKIERPVRTGRGARDARRVALLPRLRPGRGRGAARSARPGRSTKGKEIVAFGGNPNMPMTITFEVEDYPPAGREKEVCEPIVLPKGEMGNGIAACLAEMTVDGQTEEFWLSRVADASTRVPAGRHLPERRLRGGLRRRPQGRSASSSSSTISTSASTPAPSRRRGS